MIRQIKKKKSREGLFAPAASYVSPDVRNPHTLTLYFMRLGQPSVGRQGKRIRLTIRSCLPRGFDK